MLSSETAQVLERMMTLYGDPLKRTCLVYLKNDALAQDACQECFIKAYRALEKGHGPEPDREKAWLMRIAVNTCRDYARSRWFRQRKQQVPLDNLSLSADSTDQEAWEMTDAIAHLAPKLREAVLLYYYQGLTMAEVASACSVTTASIHRRLRKAEALLRHMLTGGELA